MFKIDQRFSAKGRRIVKPSNIIKFLNPPGPMEEPLPHDSERMLASGLPLATSPKISYLLIMTQSLREGMK
jgi:hypothetical protein